MKSMAILITTLAIYGSQISLAKTQGMEESSEDRFEFLTNSDLVEAEADIEQQLGLADLNESTADDSFREGRNGGRRPGGGMFGPGRRPRPGHGHGGTIGNRPRPRPNPYPRPFPQPRYVQCTARDSGWEEHFGGHTATGYDYQTTYLRALNQCRRSHGRCYVQCN